MNLLALGSIGFWVFFVLKGYYRKTKNGMIGVTSIAVLSIAHHYCFDTLFHGVAFVAGFAHWFYTVQKEDRYFG